MVAFRESITSLIADVEASNDEITEAMLATIDKNAKLLALLKDCLEYVDR